MNLRNSQVVKCVLKMKIVFQILSKCICKIESEIKVYFAGQVTDLIIYKATILLNRFYAMIWCFKIVSENVSLFVSFP